VAAAAAERVGVLEIAMEEGHPLTAAAAAAAGVEKREGGLQMRRVDFERVVGTGMGVQM
jgi:hypothetical protein